MSRDDLAQARQLYVSRCSGCHHLVLPATHSLRRWRKLLDTMAVRAQLDSTQEESVWRYLQSAKGAGQ